MGKHAKAVPSALLTRRTAVNLVHQDRWQTVTFACAILAFMATARYRALGAKTARSAALTLR